MYPFLDTTDDGKRGVSSCSAVGLLTAGKVPCAVAESVSAGGVSAHSLKIYS